MTLVEIIRRKLFQLTRRVEPKGTDLVLVFSPETGKDHYALLSDIIGNGATYPDWKPKVGGYDLDDTVTFALKLWKSKHDNNEAIPTEGDDWEEVSATEVGNYITLDGLIDAFNGQPWKQTMYAATTAALPANTMSGDFQTLTADANGVLPAIDGVPSDHWQLAYFGVLVKDEADKKKNGTYRVTDVGSAGTKWVLTRVGYNSISYVNALVPVSKGTVNKDTLWRQTIDDITLGTSILVFVNVLDFMQPEVGMIDASGGLIELNFGPSARRRNFKVTNIAADTPVSINNGENAQEFKVVVPVTAACKLFFLPNTKMDDPRWNQDADYGFAADAAGTYIFIGFYDGTTWYVEVKGSNYL